MHATLRLNLHEKERRKKSIIISILLFFHLFSNVYTHGYKPKKLLTTNFAAPVETKTATMTVGERGPAVFQDNNFIEDLAHFDRERIPERVVHAKAAGAFGYFETTHDVTKYTRLAPFAKIGKQTRMAVRFSTVAGEVGSADTVRDVRGFALKFYTEEGNWDLVGNNTPIFFVRDPQLFASFIHTQKRNPRTHLKDPDMVWDFFSLRPETMHQFLILFSDRGTPKGFRFQNGFGSHTFKLVNKNNEAFWCKFHFLTDQGVQNFTSAEARQMTAENPDYAIQDLYEAISRKDYPSWTLYIQVVGYNELDKISVNPFDLTKVWPENEVPLIPVGRMVLDRNPTNYFAEVEQLAFSPARMIPGVEPSPDKMLQGRLFSYGDTQRHRLGANFMQLPVNCPFAKVSNYQRDGPQTFKHEGGAPNYFPNSFGGPAEQPEFANHVEFVKGEVRRIQTGDEDNFSQPANFWRKELDDRGRTNLVNNIAESLINAQKFIQERSVKNFYRVDTELGRRVRAALEELSKKPRPSVVHTYKRQFKSAFMQSHHWEG